MILFISGGEIFFILLAILIFFGADKIPDFARMMGKGVREFKKATDDIKREFNENTSGVLDDIKAIGDDMSGTLTKEISEPVQETVSEAANTFEEYKDDYNHDFYYDNPDYIAGHGNEYQTETQSVPADEVTGNITDAGNNPETDTMNTEPAPAGDDAKPTEA